jgi:hypothetical protein
MIHSTSIGLCHIEHFSKTMHVAMGAVDIGLWWHNSRLAAEGSQTFQGAIASGPPFIVSQSVV